MNPEALTLRALQARFGAANPRRQFLFERFRAVAELLRQTGQVRHIYLFGSYCSAKPWPNDLDLFVVMSAEFTTTRLTGPVADIFNYETCRIRYNADLFWVTEAVGEAHIQAVIGLFSLDRTHQPQPIVEVTL